MIIMYYTLVEIAKRFLFFLKKIDIFISFMEGHELRGKMGARICLFLKWEIGFIHWNWDSQSEKQLQMRMTLRFEKNS